MRRAARERRTPTCSRAASRAAACARGGAAVVAVRLCHTADILICLRRGIFPNLGAGAGDRCERSQNVRAPAPILSSTIVIAYECIDTARVSYVSCRHRLDRPPRTRRSVSTADDDVSDRSDVGRRSSRSSRSARSRKAIQASDDSALEGKRNAKRSARARDARAPRRGEEPPRSVVFSRARARRRRTMAARATSVAPAASGLAAPRRRVVVSRRTPPPRPRPRPVVVAAAATEEVPLGTQIETALLGAFPPGCVLRLGRRDDAPARRAAVAAAARARPDAPPKPSPDGRSLTLLLSPSVRPPRASGPSTACATPCDSPSRTASTR